MAAIERPYGLLVCLAAATQLGAMAPSTASARLARALERLERRFKDAETAYRQAAEIQGARLADLSDPPDWWYPVRRSLAAALEAEGKPAEAEVEARKVLARWIDDPVTSTILAESERRQAKADGAHRLAAVEPPPALR